MALAAAAGLAVAVVSAACGDDGDPQVTEPGPTAGTASPRTTPPTAAEPPGEASPTRAPSPEPSPTALIGEVALRLTEVGTGFDAPLQVLPAPGGGLLVVEQPGRVRLLRDGQVTTYLDVSDRVTAGGERGLLGIALHPDHPSDERMVVHYSGSGGRTVVATVAAGEDSADPGSESRLLTRDQPAANHNGGQVRFGRDGFLYIGLGDGGGAGDQFGNGQRPDTLLGTILRLDIDGGDPYAIPDDNPFADGREGAPEVWAYGLRNPWRFDFDGGRLYIADVGQNAVEEVNAEPADAAGVNYGWPILEGPACFAEDDCDPSGTALPATSYRHADTGGCGVIGGEVYDGAALPALRGWFLYSDLCAGFLRAVRVAEDGTVEEADLTEQVETLERVLGFGHDADGELHIALQDGRVLRLDPAR